MYKAISLVNILSFIALTSCAAVSVNHFQGGKSLGTGKTKIGFGSQIGRSVDYDSDEDAIDNPATILFDFSVQHGLGSKFDIGADLFATLSTSVGIKLLGKYAFLDSTSKWGLALMPALGYAVGQGKRGSDEDFTQKAFITEAALLVSYDFSPHNTLLFGPSVYSYRINSKGEKAPLIGSTRQINFDRSIVSPGFSLGLVTEHIAYEVTLIPIKTRVHEDNETVERTIFFPYFGVRLFGWGGLLKLFGLAD